MNERDKELANPVTWYADVTFTELSKFAELIRADEREACAHLCEKNMFFATGEHHAKAIRARGNT